VDLVCSAPLTPAQWQWLRTAGGRFRSIRFHPDDEGTAQLVLDDTLLVRSDRFLTSSTVQTPGRDLLRGR